MALEHLFQGSALNSVDAKGRVSVPAFLRSVLERRGDGRTIVLANVRWGVADRSRLASLR